MPLKYAIDDTQCIYLNKQKCGICEKLCPAGAINFEDTKEELSLHVGSIILSTGFNSFDPSRLDNFGFNQHPDIVTSMGFERILSATGPFGGHLCLPSDKKQTTHPKKIAWLQCVGSRDENKCNNGYCSSVCCMYAVKQSIMSKDHSKEPLDCAIFYMDMRTQGKDFDKYVETARQKGVRFIRSKVHTAVPLMDKSGISLMYVTESGHMENEVFDIVVLSTGLEIGKSSIDLAKIMDIKLDRHNFIKTDSFNPVSTSSPGIYACGVLTGPKDIPQSVMEASSAAAAATENIALARHTKTKKIPIPQERDATREFSKIGVFVCNCGTNIGGVIDVPSVVEYARTLPGVIYSEENLFTCSQDTQDKMTQVIKEKGLNKVVVAACSPKTHEDLFKQTLVNAGLNKYLFEMANIRNHDSWVHAKQPEEATQKAKDLVRMAVAKSFLLTSLFENQLPVTQSGLVVGGGIAGMTAALSLARQGFSVCLVEKDQNLGGNARRLNKTYLDEDIGSYVKQLIQDIEKNDLIDLFLGSFVKQVDGFVGNFKTTIVSGESEQQISHGIAVLAVGAKESKPDEYLYGKHASILTHLDLDAVLKKGTTRIKKADNILFIQCVGSRDEAHPYCSKVCCTHSIHSAIEIKKINPEANIFILYRDIRTYGKRELIYKQARDLGILFFRYDPENKPIVTPYEEYVSVEFEDPILGRRLSVDADILCLASRIEAADNTGLSQAFKVACDSDGWLLEAHQKLRPVDFAGDGIFLCGMAHYPKPIDESIAQAKAAASRAITILAKESISIGGIVSKVNSKLCSGCEACIEVCPYGAIVMDVKKNVALINSALCKGCGACAATCPSEALTLDGFNNEQLYAQIKNAISA